MYLSRYLNIDGEGTLQGLQFKIMLNLFILYGQTTEWNAQAELEDAFKMVTSTLGYSSQE